jgi:hypothetical protein
VIVDAAFMVIGIAAIGGLVAVGYGVAAGVAVIALGVILGFALDAGDRSEQ